MRRAYHPASSFKMGLPSSSKRYFVCGHVDLGSDDKGLQPPVIESGTSFWEGAIRVNMDWDHHTISKDRT